MAWWGHDYITNSQRTSRMCNCPNIPCSLRPCGQSLLAVHSIERRLHNQCSNVGHFQVLPFYRAACNADAVLWWEFCPSVRPSVTSVNCDKTVERSVQIYIPYKRTFSLVFWEEEWLVGADPFYLKCWVNWPPLEQNRRFRTDNRS